MPKQSKQTDNTGKSCVILKFLYQSTSFKSIIKLCLKCCMLHNSLHNDTVVHGRQHTYPQQEKQIKKKKRTLIIKLAQRFHILVKTLEGVQIANHALVFWGLPRWFSG